MLHAATQALEDWDLETCGRSLDLVEAAIRSAAQDSSSATREHGRNMFGAYMQALPHRAQPFLKRVDTGLQEKLSQALLTYTPGELYTISFCTHLLLLHLLACMPTGLREG